MENAAVNVQQSKTEASTKALETAKQLNESHTDPQEGNKLDMTPEEEVNAQVLFNKTQTDDQMRLAVSQQNSANTGVVLGQQPQQLVSNILDSQQSSPTLRSDIELRTTGQFTNMQIPNQNVQQPQVLASSGPGHLKSMSSQNTNNYLSNVHMMNAADQLHHHRQQSDSQGRSTETRKQKTRQQDQATLLKGLPQGEAAKSAMLNTGGRNGHSQSNQHEIKRIPSRTKVTGNDRAGKKRVGLEPSDVHHQQSKSQGGKARQHSQQPHKNLLSHQHQQYLQQQMVDAQGNIQSNPQVMQNPQQTAAVFNPTGAGGPPMPTGDQYQGFSFMTPIGQNSFQFTAQGIPNQLMQQQQILATSQLGYQMQQQPPQVHFIAKQQVFYGKSPERAPLIFQQSTQEKRPYTSSGQVLSKRTSKSSAQNNAIAALYLGKTHQSGFNGQNQNQQATHNRQHSQPEDMHPAHAAYSMQNVAATTKGKKSQVGTGQSNSATVHRKDKSQVVGALTAAHGIYNHKLPEQLQDEIVKLKQASHSFKEENMRLKTKVKILENEMGRKERALEDFLQQNQFIQNAQKNTQNSSTLAPIVQTAQRYQAETFLVMSLKKQVKQQKDEIAKKEEELAQVKKNIKNTKFYELDQEIKMYKEELLRLRYLLEQAYTSNSPKSERAKRSSAQGLNITQSPFSIAQVQNNSQPSFMQTSNTTGQPFQIGSNSHNNFFPDTTSNLSQHNGTTSQKMTQIDQQNQDRTLSQNDDEVSSYTLNETTPAQLPPLKQNSGNSNQVQMTPLQTGMSNPLNQTSVMVNPDALSNGNGTALSQLDSRDGEIVTRLTAQLADKDGHIRKLQTQVEEFSRQRIARLTNAAMANENKGGSAGPNSKTEMTKIKNKLRDKEKEIAKLLKENAAQANNASANVEESEKKVKQLQGQLNTNLKKIQDLKSDIRKKDEKNEQLNKEVAQASDQQKANSDNHKREQNQNMKKQKEQIEEMTRQIEDQRRENERLNAQLSQKTQEVKRVEDIATSPVKHVEEEIQPLLQALDIEAMTKMIEPVEEVRKSINLGLKAEGELGLVSTVLGCRENRDRIEFAYDLKIYVAKQDALAKGAEDEEEKKDVKQKKKKTAAGLAIDYKLSLTSELCSFVRQATVQDLALVMPKYEFISPSLAMIIMSEIRKMLMAPMLLEILNEKENEKKLPFDALRDLCERFDKHFTDEHCAFVTASYLTEIDEGTIFINFKEFLDDLKDPRGASIDKSPSKLRATTSIGSDGSDSEVSRRMIQRSPLAEIINRSGSKMARSKNAQLEEEHMLDVAEAIFVKLAQLMIEKERSVRGIFTKFSTPEIFPDRTILELLSPPGFVEGIKEAGIEELDEFEMASLMRVLAKPELDNSVILNEFVMIMENFGVPDSPEEDDIDDYIPDTDASVRESVDESNRDGAEALGDQSAREESKGVAQDEAREKEVKSKEPKKKARQHNLANVDAKGIKILRKLARHLLKQFMHPREFFGKSITKEKIKTKKREFHLDVLTFKDFYLKIKIANIRKKLTDNESINNELCLDKKTHRDTINVKLMVKALEELAEEEQLVLIEEEKEEAERLKKAKEEKKKETIGEGSEVETPRSDAEAQTRANEEGKESGQTPKKKDSMKELKDSYGLEMTRFGNANIRSKNGTQSPMLGQFAHLNTIEEDKNDTQTSNYVDGASEREDSRLLSSNQLRGSNMAGLEFDEGESHRTSTHKSLEKLSKTLSRDGKQASASQVVDSPSGIDKINTYVDLPVSNSCTNTKVEGRLTGRSESQKQQQLSQSMAEASVSRFKDNEEEGSEQPQVVENSDSQATATPLTVPDKAANNDLQVQQTAPEEEEKKEENTHQMMEDEDYSDYEENEATK